MTADATQDPAFDPDWEVLARVAGGDVEAFSGLIERHQDRLLAVCSRLLGDREEARDACQDVFLRAYRKAGSYRPAGQVYTWLYRIAVNLCFNRLRRRRIVRFLPFAAPAPGSEAPVEIDPPDEGPDAARQLQARERWRETRQALDRLPANQRAVVVLAKFEGLSYREIATALGISEGAVESRLVRAMRSLERAGTAPQESGRSRVSRPGD
ncbi:MAG: RNA polymerase sigma factor [Acidobacteriota bacterium]